MTGCGARWQVAPKAQGGAKVAVANRLFGATRFRFEPDYLALVERSFGAPLEPLDYERDPDGSRKRINDWVAKRTEQRILDLLPPGSIDTDVRLTLVNAIHFLADWKLPFKPDEARDGDFTLPDGAKKRVPTMLVVLPPPEAPAAAWLPAEVLAAAAGPRSERIGLALPRFKIEMAESLELSRVLQALGMTLAFERGRADFTAIADPPDPADRLSIDKVFHKAFVRLDEKGTEAAAATAVVMKRAGAAAPPARQVRFDRPFAFALLHLGSGTPLFVGRVVDPAR